MKNNYRVKGCFGDIGRVEADHDVDDTFDRKCVTCRTRIEKAGEKSEMAFGHTVPIEAAGHHEWSVQSHEEQ